MHQKELELTMASFCQRNHKARDYSWNVRKQRIKKIKGIAFCITALVSLLTFAGIAGNFDYVAEAHSEPEQQYIVRYGIISMNGDCILTEDGNRWTLIDGPEISNGTAIRVLFVTLPTPNYLKILQIKRRYSIIHSGE